MDFLADERQLQWCRLFYRLGVFILPFLWMGNAVWFYRDAFVRAAFPQQRQMRFYVIVCFVGSLSWILVFLTWAAVDHIRRSVHQTIVDVLSFIRPMSHV